MARPQIAEGSQEYLWWAQGAADEAKARDEGLSSESLDLRRQLETLGRQSTNRDVQRTLKILMQIHCPGMLRRKFR